MNKYNYFNNHLLHSEAQCLEIVKAIRAQQPITVEEKKKKYEVREDTGGKNLYILLWFLLFPY